MSEKIIQLRHPRRANEALPASLKPPAMRAAMIEAVTRQLRGTVADVLRIDHREDHNTRDTPRRVAKMLVEETLAGRFNPPPKITTFDNAQEFEGMIVTGPIAVRSTCAHLLMPIVGEAFIGILPSASGRIIGLSKMYDRVVDHLLPPAANSTEEPTQQIGSHLMDIAAPRGMAVRIAATHMYRKPIVGA